MLLPSRPSLLLYIHTLFAQCSATSPALSDLKSVNRTLWILNMIGVYFFHRRLLIEIVALDEQHIPPPFLPDSLDTLFPQFLSLLYLISCVPFFTYLFLVLFCLHRFTCNFFCPYIILCVPFTVVPFPLSFYVYLIMSCAPFYMYLFLSLPFPCTFTFLPFHVPFSVPTLFSLGTLSSMCLFQSLTYSRFTSPLLYLVGKRTAHRSKNSLRPLVLSSTS